MRLFAVVRTRVHPDEPHRGPRQFGLTYEAQDLETAREIARIHGIDDGGEVEECMGIYEDTPDGMITHYDSDGELFEDKIARDAPRSEPPPPPSPPRNVTVPECWPTIVMWGMSMVLAGVIIGFLLATFVMILTGAE